MIRKILVLSCFLLSALLTKAQEELYMTGLLPDDGTYDLLPRKAELLTRDYTTLPTQYSLMPYCPEVKSQSRYGTCTSWATAYAARTIAEAVKYGWRDKSKITAEAFSPIFVYALIKDRIHDNDCQRGTHISKALQLMKEKGVPKYSSFDLLCANYIDESLMTEATQFKIDDYFTLFSISHSNSAEKIRKVKKSLSEDCPVVIAMWLPSSFHNAGNYWDGEDIDPTKHGYHAMCVIGYDDNLNGGSFQIMNSWGPNWGNNGFVWVKYDDFAKYVDQAFEVFVKKDRKPVPKPEPKPLPKPILLNNLSGEIELILSTGEKMLPILDSINGISRYRITDELISRTRYRIYISNNEPAYVYVIGSDLANNVSKVFPPSDNISAALTYKQNHIAIPDETYYIELDDTKGTDYMCVLYSKDALDINDIIDKIKTTEGSFYDKVKHSIPDKVAMTKEITYKPNNIGFSAKTEKTLVPIFIELNHK